MAKPLGREREFVVQVRFTVNLVELRKACRRLVARLSDESEIGTDFAVFQATGIAQGGATHSFVCPQPLESAPLLRFFARGETRFCICNAWASPQRLGYPDHFTCRTKVYRRVPRPRPRSGYRATNREQNAASGMSFHEARVAPSEGAKLISQHLGQVHLKAGLVGIAM